MSKKQTFILDYLEKQIPPKNWKIYPESIWKAYKNKEIDRDTAIYILETLFHDSNDKWGKIRYRRNCLINICKISLKTKKLKKFLEEVFITEYWYPLRLEAFSLIHTYFPKLSFNLFSYIHADSSFIEYGLRKWHENKISFIKDFIKDPLILFYLILKKEIKLYSEYISIEERKLKVNGNDLYIGDAKRFKRFECVKEFTPEEILYCKTVFFKYVRREKIGNVYTEHIKGMDKKYPLFQLHLINSEEYNETYCISKRLILALFQALKEVFSVTRFTIQLVKTSLYYLIIDIPEIDFFLKYKLNKYWSEKFEFKNGVIYQKN